MYQLLRTLILLLITMIKIVVLIIIIILIAILTALPSDAQSTKNKKAPKELTVYARVKDHLTHLDIDSTVTARLLSGSDSTFIDSVKIQKAYYEGKTYCFTQAKIIQTGKYLMLVEAKGYEPKYVVVDIPKMYKNEVTKELKPVYLRRVQRKLEVTLDEVVVTATKLKFYMDGDTLVYNADAFNLAEGSMISTLIKKLPGVEMKKGGEIFVNGQKVQSMLLNGKDFFDSDRELMLENMPAYMVKKIKSFERTPISAVGTNHEKAAQKELVMDIQLKRDYHSGWIASANAGGGTSIYKNEEGERDNKFMGKLFGLRFSDQSRLMFYANANNLNDDHTPGANGEWSPLKQTEGMNSLYKAGIDYNYGSIDRTRYYGSFHATYQEKDEGNNSSAENYLNGGNTFTRSLYSKRSYDFNIYSNHNFSLRKQSSEKWYKVLYLQFTPELYYLKYNNTTRNASATFAENVASRWGKAWMDSIASPLAGQLLKEYALNRYTSTRRGEGHWLDTKGNFSLNIAPAHNDFLGFGLSGKYQIKDNADDAFEHYRLDYPRSSEATTDFRNRYNPTSGQSQQLQLSPQLSFTLTKSTKTIHLVTPIFTFEYYHQKSNQPLYLLNKLEGWGDKPLGALPSENELLSVIDRANSNWSDFTRTTHNAGISYRLVKVGKNGGNSHLILSLISPFTHERLHHTQMTDTTVSRSTNFIIPTLAYIHDNQKRGRRIEAQYSLTTSAPDISNLVNITNTSNPLYVTHSNPNLDNTKNHVISGSYKDKYGRSILFNAAINLRFQKNAVAWGYIYDRNTGKKDVMPENVNGNWNGSVSSGIDFPLCKSEKWRMKHNLAYAIEHSVDLNGTDDGSSAIVKATRSVVDSRYLSNNIGLTFRPSSKYEFGANANIVYQHSTSPRINFETINACDFNYGLTAQVELPLNMQFSTDITMYSRRGYIDNSMNTNELVWNARLTKRMIKGKLLIQLDAFDLLGNLSNVRRIINAQGKTETFYNIIPSYCLLHLTWRIK